MRKSALMLVLGMMLLPGAKVHADTVLGIYAGASYWQTDSRGDIATSPNSPSFEFGDQSQKSYYLVFEHPVPLLPNFRWQINQLMLNGRAALQQDVWFAGQSFSDGSRLNSTLELDHTDYVFYYEVLDNTLLSLDLGINVRRLKGYASVAAVNSSFFSYQHVSDFLPMFYGSAIVGLPFSGLELFAEANYQAWDDNRFSDLQAGLAYKIVNNFMVDVRFKLGYKVMNARLDDIDHLYRDLDIKGLFAGLEFHF